MHKEWEYEVGVRDLKAVDKFGELLKKKRATVDVNTGDILGLVSNKYTPVQNKTVYEIMEQVASKIGLKLEGVSVVRDRAATIFRYNFGEERNAVVA